MPRLELRISDEQLAELDRRRGGVPRGTFLKLAAGLGVMGSAAPNAGQVAASVAVPAPVSPFRMSDQPGPSSDEMARRAREDAMARQAKLNKAKGL